ncbi:MAG: DegV family protein, partial [Clostridia bacterium]
FIPDTLGYLQKGGRIGKVQAILGTVLNIKPIILFRHAEVTNPKKSLGLTRAIADLVEMISGKVKKLFIIQVGNSPFFQKMKDAVLAKFANVAFEDGYVGPVVGAHVGPSIGVAWISE